MIYYINGKIVEKSPIKVVVEKDGIGYVVNVSLQTSENIGNPGDDVKLYTVLKIADEDINLYGFSTNHEREFFLLLIGVPNIGPKVALRILSGSSVEEIYNAISNEDPSFFTKIPGVGKKTGERLIVELKQKIDKIELVPSGESIKTDRELFSNAVDALTVLGYKRAEAISSVKKILSQSNNKSLTLEEVIRETLKKL
ncbi:MAG TPA: Holliday junction branch migration protein RuvA [Candidatus Ratteibacteria bacterium]|nr:Holliday junction branch migration protein RuvA [Candidatus Ratteibacteria bacterium]